MRNGSCIEAIVSQLKWRADLKCILYGQEVFELFVEFYWFSLICFRNLSHFPGDTVYRLDHVEGALGTEAPLANLSKLMENSAARYFSGLYFHTSNITLRNISRVDYSASPSSSLLVKSFVT